MYSGKVSGKVGGFGAARTVAYIRESEASLSPVTCAERIDR
jgi:hypothetical protein